MGKNRSLMIAIVGIVIMSLIVPIILSGSGTLESQAATQINALGEAKYRMGIANCATAQKLCESLGYKWGEMGTTTPGTAYGFCKEIREGEPDDIIRWKAECQV